MIQNMWLIIKINSLVEKCAKIIKTLNVLDKEENI
jgi:hypothetical protein